MTQVLPDRAKKPRIKLDGVKFGWLADGKWPLKFWEAFWVIRSFTLAGPMTTVAAGPLIIWIYWSYK
jgi:hypothetical protein